MSLLPILPFAAAACLSLLASASSTAATATRAQTPAGVLAGVPAGVQTAPLPAQQALTLKLEPVWPAKTFDRPVDMVQDPRDGGFFILEQHRGRVLWAKPGQAPVTLLDLGERIGKDNEEGLLGIALHPSFPADERVFLYYSAKKPRRSVLSSFRVGARSIDPASERIIMEIAQPYGNHNGGHLLFGPDKQLYIGLGDGGAGGDPHGHAQNVASLLGKILRIDIDKPAAGKAYGIPPDNPFVKSPGFAPEIWALGLRNPWRMCFDSANGMMLCGDVGQNRQEEVDVIVKGGNYGWNKREGRLSFPKGQPGSDENFEEPIFVYGRDLGVSITGGHIYRGSALPLLHGRYLCADFATGRAWTLRQEASGQWSSATATFEPQGATRVTPSSFAVDAKGELYLLCYGQNTVWKISEATLAQP